MQSKPHYIFGYGSLINSQSRLITGIAGNSVPVRVAGLQRYWVSFIGGKMRSVGVIPTTQQNQMLDNPCNGVLFEVPEQELPKFDQRESGYTRQLLDWHTITPCNPNTYLNTQQPVWVYIYAGHPNQPQIGPISQAYLDVILLGCLEHNEAFAIEFLQNTKNWYEWVDDRTNPLYPRATQHQQQTYLDTLIAQQIAEFNQRYGLP